MSGDDPELRQSRLVAVAGWLSVADRDARGARACLDAPEPIPEVAAYLCQQAAEKLTKSLLVLAGARFAKTYDIVTLRDAAIPHFPELGELLDELVPLTPWAHSYRYPGMDADPPPGVEELRAVLTGIDALARRIGNLADPTSQD